MNIMCLRMIILVSGLYFVCVCFQDSTQLLCGSMFPFLPLSLSHSAKKVFIASADLSGYADTFAMVSDENNDDWMMNLGDDTVFDDADFNQPNKFVDDKAYDENNDDWKMDFGDDKVFDDAYFNPPNQGYDDEGNDDEGFLNDHALPWPDDDARYDDGRDDDGGGKYEGNYEVLS